MMMDLLGSAAIPSSSTRTRPCYSQPSTTKRTRREHEQENQKRPKETKHPAARIACGFSQFVAIISCNNFFIFKFDNYSLWIECFTCSVGCQQTSCMSFGTWQCYLFKRESPWTSIPWINAWQFVLNLNKNWSSFEYRGAVVVTELFLCPISKYSSLKTLMSALNTNPAIRMMNKQEVAMARVCDTPSSPC